MAIPGEGIRKLVDCEIDDTIRMMPDFSAVFNSPVIGFDALGVEREADFYLGMAWPVSPMASIHPLSTNTSGQCPSKNRKS
jgi:hypothetical protein